MYFGIHGKLYLAIQCSRFHVCTNPLLPGLFFRPAAPPIQSCANVNKSVFTPDDAPMETILPHYNHFKACQDEIGQRRVDSEKGKSRNEDLPCLCVLFFSCDVNDADESFHWCVAIQGVI